MIQLSFRIGSWTYSTIVASHELGQLRMRTFANVTRVLVTKSGGFPPREPPSEPSPVKPAHCEPENDRRKDQGQPCHPRGPAP